VSPLVKLAVLDKYGKEEIFPSASSFFLFSARVAAAVTGRQPCDVIPAATNKDVAIWTHGRGDLTNLENFRFTTLIWQFQASCGN
jgi:hypothetical protein